MKILLLASAAIVVSSAVSFADETAFKATLVSQTVLPANSVIAAPADAPAFLKQAGKFSTPDRKRATTLGSVPGLDGVRKTGLGLPFDGQAMQGFSGIKTMTDGTFWTLSDNGFGSKANSSDAMLMLHHVKLDWQAGTVDRLDTVFLSDPDKLAPFPIAMEGADKRYLTGADFDIESIQPVGDGFWIGEELGPYLIHVTADGKLTDVIPTLVDGKPVLSPDNPTMALPADPTKPLPAFNVRRSNGFEGLARSKDSSKLYALMEGPLYLGDGKFEQVDGANAIRIIEFDVAKKAWTGRSWLYPFSGAGTNIGDFNMIDESTALVIERDGGAGLADKACADPAKPEPTCFDKPSRHKRIYKIAFGDDNVGKAVRKVGYIDLLNIADANGKAKQGTENGIYTMPFVTIENVDVVDATHIVVGNDNNLPFSAGRAVDKADDNEFVLLEVGEFLAAK
ncbi:glycerophosphodiester phosphodiesterase [Pleomorphomonas diazotrophica]|uniref:Glycerophosphodiester phosphodiesterase n=1 Tax=Pleomorphomonas diazotrophica TaxID=1166257 RepID=A0A1I4QHV8_9HYPH|nr:esterase-like activity of phytase family protein [Pleomorphomonas diazotrophica]PKR90664.1 glycerophosphodiester phosphodiesterase [Pleomorphomonas diazotrophica]SFM39356.1 Uncharacterized conserved protein [Pleomorphomonas diazotrophica]